MSYPKGMTPSYAQIDWNQTNTDKLRELWAAGVSGTAISIQMFGCPDFKNAVIGKVHRLKLPDRPRALKVAHPLAYTTDEKALLETNLDKPPTWFLEKLPNRTIDSIRVKLKILRRRAKDPRPVAYVRPVKVVKPKKPPAPPKLKPKRLPVVKLPRHIPIIDYGAGPGCCTFLVNDRWPWKQCGLKAEYNGGGRYAEGSAAVWCQTHRDQVMSRKVADQAA